MNRTIILQVAAVLVTAVQRVNAAPPSADALVLVGAGQAGNWTTGAVLASTSQATHIYQIGVDADYAGGACPSPCPFSFVQVDGNATAAVRFSDTSLQGEFVGAYYVVPDDGETLPVSTSQLINLATEQVNQLPVFKLSTLLALDTSRLVFAGAHKSSTGRTDLVLSSLRTPGRTQVDTSTVRVDVLDAGGTTIGSEEMEIPYGQSVFLVDELGHLGITQLDLGQVRVSRIAGSDAIWGTMASIADDGAVTLSVGANP